MFRQSVSRFTTGVCLLILIVALYGQALSDRASAASVTLYPNSDAVSGWSTGGASDGSCANSHCTRLDEPTAITSDYIQTGLLSGSVSDEFHMTSGSVGQGATQVVVRIMARSGLALQPLDSNDTLTVRLWVNGAYVTTGTSTVTPAFPGWETYNIVFSGFWSQSDVDDMRIRVTNNIVGILQNDLHIAWLNAVVTYTPEPVITQAAYRLYDNTDAVVPGAPLGLTNGAAELPYDGAAFRLRVGLHVGAAALPAGYANLKLQVALQSGSCDTGFAGESYQDVMTGSGAIRWQNNVQTSDGSAIAAYEHDPVTAGINVYQSYRESGPFALGNSVPVGNTAIWDLALWDAAAEPGSVYCFRLITDDGELLDDYSAIPEVRTVGTLTADMVDSSGASIPNPLVTFTPLPVDVDCLSASATLGTASQRVRFVNDLAVGGWAASIAPTAGPAGLWTSGAESYDYNDSYGCQDGPDADAKGGALSIDASGVTILAEPGCSTAGLTLSPQHAFTEGLADSLAIAAASASSQRFCFWDLEGIMLYQQVPAAQPPGAYEFELTLTIVAQ